MVASGSVKVGEMRKSDSNKVGKQDFSCCCLADPRAACNLLSSLILDLIPRKQSCALPGITFFCIISNHFPARSDLCDNAAGDRADVHALNWEE